MNNAPANSTKTPPKIFISYRREDDMASARSLSDCLKQSFGRKAIFFDLVDIPAGDLWRQTLKDAISSSALMLVVIGPRWMSILNERAGNPGADQVRMEIQTAIEAKIKIFPLCLDRPPLPNQANMSAFPDIAALAEIQKIDIENRRWSHGIEDLLQAVEQATGLRRISAKPLKISNVTEHNTLFTGRDGILSEIHATLNAGASVALCGLPGVGKSEIAREYAHRYSKKYSICLWANAASEEILAAQFKDLGRWLQLEEPPDQDLAALVTVVKDRLQQEKNWLLILDNANDTEMADEFFSGWTCGHLLMTSTNQRTVGIAERLPVKPLDAEEGALLLLRRAGRLTARKTLEDAEEGDRRAALLTSRAMGGLPLALDQAGAYIEADCTPEEYLAMYREMGEKLRKEHIGHRSHQHESVTITLSLAFEQFEGVEGGTGCAPDLLRLCAFLAPDAIPEEMLVCGASEFGRNLPPVRELGESLASALEAPLSRRNMIGEACRFSLLGRDADHSLLHVHRLVQEVLKDQMEDETQREWAERVVQGVNLCLPDPSDVSAVAAFQRMWPHTDAAVELMKRWSIEPSVSNRPGNAYSLNDFIADHDVQKALTEGKGWVNLLGKNINYTGMFAATHLEDLHNLEGARMQRQMRRVVLSLRRNLADPREARLAFCCMYFVAHYWWDCYLPDDNICPPLLQMWPHGRLPDQPDPDDDALEAALNAIQQNYPPVWDYQNRTEDREKWIRLREAVETLRSLLVLDGPIAEVSEMKASERYVRAITDIYLAEACRYAPTEDSQAEDALWALYAEAERLLHENEDLFHENWSHFEYAEALRESGDRLLTADMAEARRRFKRSADQSRLALSGSLAEAGENTEDEGGGYWIDSELIANAYRIGADIAWSDEKSRPQAWMYHCAAALAAYAFLLSEGDTYARAFYSEQRDRAMERFNSLSADGAAPVGKFIADFWGVHWNSLPAGPTDDGLFPPVPSPEQVKKPEENGLTTPYRETIARVLRAMPETVERLAGESHLYTTLLYFKRVLKCLQNIPLA